MNKIRRVGLVGIGICLVLFAKYSHSTRSTIVILLAFSIFFSMAIFGGRLQKN